MRVKICGESEKFAVRAKKELGEGCRSEGEAIGFHLAGWAFIGVGRIVKSM